MPDVITMVSRCACYWWVDSTIIGNGVHNVQITVLLRYHAQDPIICSGGSPDQYKHLLYLKKIKREDGLLTETTSLVDMQ